MDITRLKKAIMDEIVDKQLAPNIENLVQQEVIKELGRLGISKHRAGRERIGHSTSLFERGDLRRRIGTLNTQRFKDGIAERVRFKLNGLQDRRGGVAISEPELRKIIKRVIEKKFK